MMSNNTSEVIEATKITLAEAVADAKVWADIAEAALISYTISYSTYNLSVNGLEYTADSKVGLKHIHLSNYIKYKEAEAWANAYKVLINAKLRVIKALEAKAEAWANATYFSAKASNEYTNTVIMLYAKNELWALDEYNVFCNHAVSIMNEANNE